MTRHLLRVSLLVLVCCAVPQWHLAAQKADSAVPANADAQTVLHVLNRIAYGPRPGDIARVQQIGLAAYIDQQLHPERLVDAEVAATLAAFPTLTMSQRDLASKIYEPAEKARRDQQTKAAKADVKQAKSADDAMLAADARAKIPQDVKDVRQQEAAVLQNLTQARILRAALSERQLNEVLVDFWFNHFNVYAQKGAVNQYLNTYERDAIRPYVLGRFRDMLGAVAHHPAMLFYLDNYQSADPRMSQRLGRGGFPVANNPNAPKGINENYARELMELHTLGVDGGYTQKDVQEVARVFTGWTIDQPRAGGSFVFRPAMHDPNMKTVLGQTITGFPSVDGMREGERVLDLLAMHPKTAHHIAYQLAQRFVADTPPASLVDRAAQVFLDTKGDLREVTRAIITSPEFFSVEAYGALVKTPLDFAISALRATNASITVAAPVVQALRTTLGMPLYGCMPPTGYKTTADAWVNTGALLARMNFGLQLVSNQQRQIHVNLAALAPDTSAGTRATLAEQLLGGRVSPTTAATLARATAPAQMVALLLGSPEFQKR